MDPRVQEGFLRGTLMADITLLLYFPVIIAAMLLGFYFARRKMFRPYHKLTMTAVLLINWALILYQMLNTYRGLAAVGQIPTLVLIHLITGGIAQILGTYLVILMWTEKTALAWIVPKPLRINSIKTPMRLTLTLWLVTALLGIGIYLSFYTAGPSAAGVESVETPEAAPETMTTEEASDAAPAETPEASADTEDDEPVETEEAEVEATPET